jgi:RecB family endonuclease NucS
MFNPNSVMQAVSRGRCRSFWAGTASFTNVVSYIQRDFEGLKDDVLEMLAGGRVSVDPTGFQNDLSEICSRDDVLTVLIHLGYLSYNWRRDECYIPNREVAGEMVNAVKSTAWTVVARALQQSERLLKATLQGDADTVARMVEAAHDSEASIYKYNDENTLSCVISIAYYYAHGDHIFHRELPTGKGYADLVLMPRKNVNKPAIVIELKSNKAASKAIEQIKSRHYTDKVAEYTGDILLVGICYDREAKTHDCIIEPLTIEP